MSYGDVRLVWAPIQSWPREQTKSRDYSPFRSPWRSGQSSSNREIGWTQTEPELHHELRSIGVKEAVIQLALRERDIRIDGQVRADARPSHPGVILTITHPKQGPLSFACDKWTTWQANIRGITKGLEALRLVDRYGITSTGDQYAGFKELASGVPLGPNQPLPPITRADAARIIAGAVSHSHDLEANTRLVLTDEDFRRYAYRVAVKLAHPDTGATESEGFLRIQQAKEVLDADD